MVLIFVLLFGTTAVVFGQSTTFPALCSVPSSAAQLGGDSRPFDRYSETDGEVRYAFDSLQAVAGYVSVVLSSADDRLSC